MSTITIDDSDSSVKYSGQWLKGGSSREVDGTVHSSSTPGSSFQVPFLGTSISVFGTVDISSGGVITSYSIDGGAAVPITSKSTGGDSYKQLFWTSGPLSADSHILEVKMVNVNPPTDGPGEGTIWFDYFQVAQGNAASSSAPASTTAAASTSAPASIPTSNTALRSSTSTGTGTSTAGLNDATLSSSSTGTSLPVSTKSSNKGGLVGGVIVALLVILGLTAFFLYWRNRKRRRVPDGEIKGEAYPFVDTPPRTPGTGAASPFNAATPFDAKFEPYAGFSSPPPPGAFAGPPSAYNSSSRSGSRPTTPTSRRSLDTTTSMAIPPSRAFVVRNDLAAQGSMYNKPSAGPTTLTYTPPITASVPLSLSASTPDPDSVAELKRRQQEHIAQYNQRLLADDIGGTSSQLVQHVDSGIRTTAPVTEELPPVYTPA
ncbi:hypothetical protein C8J56DRAFT_949597 [Mycena floridula]|nr:hypothetical protein C8J56DRAFT_949597 [Mycena floridula]